ncbi:MAG: tRNA (adenosine(37)-N6)-dimethylallyltransferase MiaA [Gemmatimonadetes bacterium]|nr:tRNA (adenosine(37)-N6)-dimethylallyltransferase MiaA [Gemmatimonadota bacterium]
MVGGATATGKSEVAAELAAELGGVVISADSRQVYRGLEIGTAQPHARLRELAPHRLVGFLSPAASYSAGQYGDDARRVLAILAAAGRPAVLCGGTGLYIRAALRGLAGPHAPPRERRNRREALARRWAVEGAEAMHAELARVDPGLATRIHSHDRQRVLRGLEFYAEHAMPLSAAWREAGFSATEERPRGNGVAPAPIASLRYRLELSGAELDRRIAERLAVMLREGLVEEARALRARYGDDTPRSLEAVGYAELFAHFRGEVRLDEALERIRVRTRRYAKRQRTWFRNQDDYAPVPAERCACSAILSAWRKSQP